MLGIGFKKEREGVYSIVPELWGWLGIDKAIPSPLIEK